MNVKKNLYFTCVLVFYARSFYFTLFLLCLKILCWKFFFWTIFKEKIVVIPIFVPLYILCLFSLLAYRICVLLLDLSTLSMMDQVYIFWFVCFRFLMFGICCISWICSLLYSRNLSFQTLFLQSAFALAPSIIRESTCMSMNPFQVFPKVTDAMFISNSLCSLSFILYSLFCNVFKFTNIFFCSVYTKINLVHWIFTLYIVFTYWSSTESPK